MTKVVKSLLIKRNEKSFLAKEMKRVIWLSEKFYGALTSKLTIYSGEEEQMHLPLQLITQKIPCLFLPLDVQIYLFHLKPQMSVHCKHDPHLAKLKVMNLAKQQKWR
jgi:hypothetical protein